MVWLGTYAGRTPGVQLSVESTVYPGPDSEVQPDALLYRIPFVPGRLHRTAEGHLVGAPDLIVEIAASSASYDTHDKNEAYRRAGVPAYVVYRTLDAGVDWFRLVDGRSIRIEPNAQGMIESTSFPGLRLHVAVLLADVHRRLVSALTRRRPRRP